MDNYIIGITAYGRTGKDTFADIATESFEKRGYNIKRFSFAKYLKESLKDLVTRELGLDVFTDDDKEKALLRPLFVEWGEVCRGVDVNYFINKIKKDVEKALKVPKTCVIITDVRFENEVLWVKSFIEGIVIGLKRNGVTAPNEQERINIPKIFKNYDILSLNWENVKKEEFSLTNPTLCVIVDNLVRDIVCV